MRRKQAQRAALFHIGDVLDRGPRDRHAVESAGAAPDFIQYYQRIGGRVREYLAQLAHLDHECGLAAVQVVARAYAREYAVGQAYVGLMRGHEAAYLRH